VILKNRDFKDRDQLMKEFCDQLTQFQNDGSLEPWEQISAAIGYAVYDAGEDSSVEDVFKRADKAMYEMKTAMKAERKD
jgi:GGDEF domain-containing protein